jgi:hypothetical protein
VDCHDGVAYPFLHLRLWIVDIARAMAATAAQQPPHRPANSGGGGSGFLFGNIDERGRLDEDYLDDDAKDHLDNVAPTVAERDPSLREITDAVPKQNATKSRPTGSGAAAHSDSEGSSRGDFAPTEHADTALDFYDEDEVMEDLDETERARLASLALSAVARKASNVVAAVDDENYDDEDEDDTNDKKNDGGGSSSGKLLSGNAGVTENMNPALCPPSLGDANSRGVSFVDKGLPDSSSPRKRAFPQSSSQPEPSTRVDANKVKSVVTVVQNSVCEEAVQQKLMEAARKGATLEELPNAEVVLEPLPDDEPLRFSEVLTRKPKLKIVQKRKRYGVVSSKLANTSDREHQLPIDDAVKLETPLPLPGINPVELFLRLDRIQTKKHIHENVADRGWSEPDTIGGTTTLRKVWDKPHSISESDDEVDFAAPLSKGLDRVSCSLVKDDTERHAIIQQVAWEREICWADSDENQSNDSDDDVPVSEQQTAEPKVVVSDSEDDDDMEWEEGNTGQVPNSTPLAENAKSLTMQASDDGKRSISPDLDKTTRESKVPGQADLDQQVHSRSKDDSASRERQKIATGPGAQEMLPDNMNVPCTVDVTTSVVCNPLITTILAPNADLEEGLWVRDVEWDSDGDCRTSPLTPRSVIDDLHDAKSRLSGRTDRLILDMNDENMQLEIVPSSSGATGADRSAHGLRQDIRMTQELQGPSLVESDELSAIPGNLLSIRPVDPFNISNDKYYVKRNSGSMLKLDRRAILRGLRNAPPAIKAQTTIPNPSDEYLTRFHRPVLELNSYPGADDELVPFRRKHPKGGSSQIAGQIPKKSSELLASSKDAFRICLFEYALEYEPCLLPVPGTAFRVVTYDRKESARAAAQARKDATGTPDADTVFMAPEEVPPLHAGDLKQNEKPLLVLESHLFSAPCARAEPGPCDFLVTRRRGKMYVREIDSVVSVGVTEPKVEVMAPNTERFKKFAKDRVLLWLLREFLKNQKKKDGNQKKKDGETVVASIDREQLFAEFSRRRTFPETSLIKMLKELSRYQNGKYVLMEEPPKGFAAMDAELLRTINPEETSAFESMEAGWHRLINLGIHIFTHPTTQSNIRSAAEKTGLRAGPAVGNLIWNRLQHTPWYRSQVMISVQRQQRKELMQTLASARIANDLREGGAVMEARVASLSAAEAANVLANQYRVQARKIPQDLDARRTMVREHALKKSKGADRLDYQEIIGGIIAKNRTAGGSRTAPGAGATAVVASGDVLTIPLEQQRLALEQGIVRGLPKEEEERALLREIAEAERSLANASERNVTTFQRSISSPTINADDKNEVVSRTPLRSKKHGIVACPPTSKFVRDSVTLAGNDTAVSPASAHGHDQGSGHEKTASSAALGDSAPKKKKIKRKLKITRKVTGSDGNKIDVVKYITDPVEIERMLAKNRAKSLKKHVGAVHDGGKPSESAPKDAGGSASAGGGPLKIQINLRKLSQGKASGRSKTGISASERKRSAVESKRPVVQKADNNSLAIGPITISQGDGREAGPKGHVGKLKINPKLARQAQEELLAKRKRSQYGEDLEYPSRKVAKKSSTSRRKRNGTVLLNGIIETIERIIRETDGYIKEYEPEMVIARVRPGEKVPPDVVPRNLSRPSDSFLDFTKAVDTKSTPTYKDIVKKQMYLDLIKYKCKEMKYTSSQQFLADMKLLVDNARAFNSTPDVRWVVLHAELLYEVAKEQLDLRTDEISAAEDQVKKEQAGVSGTSVAGSKRSSKKGGKRQRDSSKGHRSKSRSGSREDDAKNSDERRHQDSPGSAGESTEVRRSVGLHHGAVAQSSPFLSDNLAPGFASPDLNVDINGSGDDEELDLPEMDL